MIEYLRGDLFLLSNCTSFMQGCNAVGVMGKGIALSFKKRWPVMFKEYKQACINKEISCGEVFIWRNNDLVIFNAITQPRLGACASYEYVKKCCSLTKAVCENDGIARVGLPKIGAGIGGLDWPEVKRIMETELKHTSVLFSVIEDYVEGLPPVLSSEKKSV